ncbi:hypothetical protein E2562_032197 [Oryza meyeriana var. granulata]|uniref:Uncharacterized protein n=1 Tax=Oryza meyeriana var. granulata TaxID=110450 RepID=A0A6G1F0J4_9ORYZ|nr:hypothetical protein E2562_032197 [Oryza meyeriana var. granulata]
MWSAVRPSVGQDTSAKGSAGEDAGLVLAMLGLVLRRTRSQVGRLHWKDRPGEKETAHLA